MKVGVPKEVKNREYRVALTPIGVHELVQHGHEVVVQKTAGRGLADPRRGVRRRGRHDARHGRRRVGHRRHGPQGQGAGRGGVRPDAGGPDPLHLPPPRRRQAADRGADRRARSPRIAYETVQLPSGGLPLLYPMSEVAGCLAPQVGAHSLLKAKGGRGVLMGGVGGVANAKVVIIGAGVSGQNAANIALGMGADVTLLDTDLDKLRMSFWRYNNRVHGLASSKLAIEQQVMEADMVIGAVLIPGAAAPKLVTNDLVSRMKPGSVLVDIADRPGRLLRGLPRHHARRPDLRGARLGVLLRGQHARRGAATPRRTPSPTRRCPTPWRWPTRAGSRRCATTTASRSASTPTPASSPTGPSARRVGIDVGGPRLRVLG